MFDKVQQKVHQGWSFSKKLFAWLSVWGLIFSLVTIGRLSVAFDYDDTLVFSNAAFNKAFQSGSQPLSPQFWTIVNQSYDLERPKLMINALAWVLRACGFKVAVLASRPADGGEALKKEWRHLVSQFIFVPEAGKKHVYLNQKNYVLYLGDTDDDISEGRAAHVWTLRVRRSSKSINKEGYHPGMFGEWVIPYSQY